MTVRERLYQIRDHYTESGLTLDLDDDSITISRQRLISTLDHAINEIERLELSTESKEFQALYLIQDTVQSLGDSLLPLIDFNIKMSELIKLIDEGDLIFTESRQKE